MCGIAGIVMRDGAVAGDDLAAMARALDHRGPEDQGSFTHRRVGLVHTRLSIIDLAGGHQPLQDATAGLTLVANGEIYNHVELRDELQGLGRRFATRSDSECALQAWAAWGEDSLPRLNGMFAYALHDARNDDLVLVRDRLGIKPLYFTALPDRFVFASEIKALLPVLGRAPAPAPAAVAQFLGNQFSSGRDTAIRDVQRLLPGERLRLRADGTVELRRWWTPTTVRTVPREMDEAVEAFEPLFAQVMTEHMRSDVPYGVFLSGGVDSALLLATLREHRDRPVSTFSVGWSDAEMDDELDDATRIARHFGADHTPLRLSRAQVFRRLPLAAWAADDLMRDYACLPTLALAEHAGASLKVVFSGEGGDEAFAGYRRYAPAWAETAYKRLRWPGSGGFRVRSELDAGWLTRMCGPALREALTRRRTPFIQAWSATPDGWSDLQRRQFVDLVTNLPDDLLVKADRMLMAFSVEGRVPFLDHRVIEFGLSLPDDLKAAGGVGKRLLRRWGAQRVPADHLVGKKRGFHVPVREWLGGDFLAGLARALPQARGIREWFEPAAVHALLARQAGRGDVSREVWSLLQFAIWHRLFIEGRGERPSTESDPLQWLA